MKRLLLLVFLLFLSGPSFAQGIRLGQGSNARSAKFILLNNGPICLDGDACVRKISYDGTQINIVVSGATALQLVDSSGNSIFNGSVRLGNNLANYLTIAGAAANNPPSLTAAGSDTNIGISLVTKGTGNTVQASGQFFALDGTSTGNPATGIRLNGSNFEIRHNSTANALYIDTGPNVWANGGSIGSRSGGQNYISMSGTGGVGTPVSITAAGLDTNVGIDLIPKGTGSVRVNNQANTIAVAGAAAASAPTITAAGSDTDVGISLVPKGAGSTSLLSNSYLGLDGSDATPNYGLRYNSASTRIEFRTNGFLGGFWDQNGALTGTGNIYAQGTIRAGVTNQTNVLQLAGSSSTNPVALTLSTGSVGISYTASQANSGTNVAHIFDNSVALTGTTLLASFRSNGVEKANIDNSGSGTFNNVTINGTCTGCGGLTVGSPANGLAIASNQITLAAATGSVPGALTATTQTIGGKKTFSGEIDSQTTIATTGSSEPICVNYNGSQCNGMTDDGSNLLFKSQGSTIMTAPHSNQNVTFAGTIIAGFRMQFTATAIPTCNSANEALLTVDSGSGGTGTTHRTRLCLCTSDGGASPAYAWRNIGSGTVGTTSACND